MAVTNQVATVLKSHLLDRSNFPGREPRQDFYFVQARHVQAGAGDADSDVMLFSFPAGTIGGTLLALFREPYGADGLVSIGLGEHLDAAGETVEADVNTFVDAADAALAGLHKFEFGFFSLEGVNLILTFTTGAASTLPDTTVHELFLVYSVIPPVV